jgi:nicotinic acid mononucleotide adenylyltransferase
VKDLWLDRDLHAIFGEFGVAVCDRVDVDLHYFISSHPILNLYADRIHIIPSTIMNNISSTAVRTLLQQQLSVKYLIPDRVREYIEKNMLYGWKPRQIPK